VDDDVDDDMDDNVDDDMDDDMDNNMDDDMDDGMDDNMEEEDPRKITRHGTTPNRLFVCRPRSFSSLSANWQKTINQQ